MRGHTQLLTITLADSVGSSFSEHTWIDLNAPPYATEYRLQYVGASGEVGWLGTVSVSAIPATYNSVKLSNHPNPFNPNTVISFELSQPMPVELAVFDLLGKRVRTLIAASTSAGTHHSIWDGRDESGLVSPSGVYFVRLRAGDRVKSQKISLVR